MSTICGAGTAYSQEHPSSPPVLSGVRVSQSLVFCVVFCKSLFVLFLSVSYCIVCPSSIYGFWLPLLVQCIFKLFLHLVHGAVVVVIVW